MVLGGTAPTEKVSDAIYPYITLGEATTKRLRVVVQDEAVELESKSLPCCWVSRDPSAGAESGVSDISRVAVHKCGRV